MSTFSTSVLDHIVHLSPPGSIDEVTKQFQDIGFTVIPGGTHADGLTANALVVLRDGVYLELISFTHEPSYYDPDTPEYKQRISHKWANEQPGWVDFAHLGMDPQLYEIINARGKLEESGVAYTPAQNGGRARPDGKVLEWRVTFPDERHGRGSLPFFCEDITPRAWRVPVEAPSSTQHACAALGIAHIRLLSSEQDYTIISRQLTTVLGEQPILSTSSSTTWVVTSPNTQVREPQLVLSLPDDEVERESGAGIYEVGIWVGKGKGGSVKTPYGKIVWSPVE